MDIIFESLQNKNVSWYIDNIIVYTDSKMHMYELIEKVFAIMVNSGLYIKPAKLTLMKDHALALGHIVNWYG